MFFSLLGGPPKPEPEQVIKNYTEELKVAPDEVRVMGATLLVVLFGNNGWLQATSLSSAGRCFPRSLWPCLKGQSGFLWLTQPASTPVMASTRSRTSLLSLILGQWHHFSLI